MSECNDDHNNRDDIVTIPCIGVDNKQHVCEPHLDECYCGVKIKRKQILRDDYKLFSCWECTY